MNKTQDHFNSVKFSPCVVVIVQLLSHLRLFATPWTAIYRCPCPSLSPGACSNSCTWSWWCHPTISFSVIPFSSSLQSFPTSSSFPMRALHIRWPQYRSFSISPSNEYSGLIPFRTDWFDLPPVQGTLKSFLQHHSSKASILRLSAFFSPYTCRP